MTARLAEKTAENQARLAELQAKAKEETKAIAKAARAKFIELEIIVANAATPGGGEGEAHRDGVSLL